MVIIKNRQRSIPFDNNSYKKKAENILNYLKYSDFDVSILLTTNRTIQRYNHQFRNKNKATDVLSFPYHTNLQAGKRIKAHCDEDKNLGDIIISIAYVFDNKHHLEGDFKNRMNRMLVHGICHLLGYDHETDVDYKKMFTLEQKLMKLIEN